MRTVIIWSFLLLLGCAVAPALATSKAPAKTEHPANVALLQETSRWLYVHFPSNLRLYINDKDSAGKSLCNRGCDTAWPPLKPDDLDGKPIGDWAVMDRADGSKQWAYKGRPVYLRYHDSVEAPSGTGVDGVWRFLEP